MISALVLAVLLGASWRRWWGFERPPWAYPGYRATQAAAGFVVLALIQVVAGDYFWRCALDSALAIAWLSLPIKVSLYGHTQFWKWVDERLGAPRLPYLEGYTAYAELTGGLVAWTIAVIL